MERQQHQSGVEAVVSIECPLDPLLDRLHSTIAICAGKGVRADNAIAKQRCGAAIGLRLRLFTAIAVLQQSHRSEFYRFCHQARVDIDSSKGIVELPEIG